MSSPQDWKCCVLSRDNRHGRTFQSVYFVSAPLLDQAKSQARLRWLDDWSQQGEAVSWISCRVELLEGEQIEMI